MKNKLRILSVAFDTPIEPWELRAFRGAVARKAGWEHELFHNHNNETGGFHYRLKFCISRTFVNFGAVFSHRRRLCIQDFYLA